MQIFIILQFILILFLLFLEIKQIKIKIYIKKNALCCYEFIKSMGPNISAVSVVAIFIPMENVPIWILIIVFICGIIITKMADYAIRKTKG